MTVFILYSIIVVQNENSILTFIKEKIMWTKPTATEMRFGFEVTMYVMNK